MRYIPYIALATALLPWLVIQINIITPGDAAFLIYGAQHLLNGHSMAEFYYDNNPPMSFLVYIPAALLNNLSIPPYMVSNIYALIVILSALASIAFLLKRNHGLSTNTQFVIFSSCALAITIPHISEFGQKDHLIAIGLIPFILAQKTITQNLQEKNFGALIILCLFTPFILIKPHYGLIPAAIILHRAINNKSINRLKDYDFIVLGLGTIIYITYISINHPDFIHEIFPIVHKLYTQNIVDESLSPYIKTALFLFFTASLATIIKLSDQDTKDDDNKKHFALFFAIAAILSVIPFGVQNKGFSLHLIPTTTLSIISIGIYLPTLIKTQSKILIFPIVLALGLYAYVFISFIPKGSLITHNQYVKSDIIKTITKNSKNESFFIEDSTTCATYTSATYIDNQIGSRFPSMWFLNGALALKNEKQKIEILDKFGKHLSEDFNKFKPQMIAFMLNKEGRSPLKVVYKNHELFQQALKHYEFKEEITINDIYPCYRGESNENNLLTLEIYTRIDN